MKSKWFELKPEAIKLRKQGKSIRNIESTLSIPRSTLSGWLKNIELSYTQKQVLKNKHYLALVNARKLATIWHNNKKKERIQDAENKADKILEKIMYSNEIIELSLALLYLGEGFKNNTRTGMGNSDPLLLKFFLSIMTGIYNIDINKIGFELHLRADQNPDELKKYWSKELNAPINRFTSVSIDNRTIGKATYDHYKGVCIINCSNVAIQRKLVYIGRKFCEKVIKNMRD